MDEDNQAFRDETCKHVVMHPGPPSMEDLLRYIDPAPDDETERFVAAIYSDRRAAGKSDA